MIALAVQERFDLVLLCCSSSDDDLFVCVDLFHCFASNESIHDAVSISLYILYHNPLISETEKGATDSVIELKI